MTPIEAAVKAGIECGFDGELVDMFTPDDARAIITAFLEAAAGDEDVSKVAGHSGKAITAKVYDRDTVESHRRMRKTIAGTPSGTRDNGE